MTLDPRCSSFDHYDGPNHVLTTYCRDRDVPRAVISFLKGKVEPVERLPSELMTPTPRTTRDPPNYGPGISYWGKSVTGDEVMVWYPSI
jgi:hypothetical protein